VRAPGGEVERRKEGVSDTAEREGSSGTDVVVGRQPIFDRTRTIIGHELLFRTLPGAVPEELERDGDLMTAEVLVRSVSIGVERLVGGALAFVNGDRGLLTGDVPIVLPPERVVIEVLETVGIDDEVVRGCRHLAAQGYRLALDDFTWSPGVERLLELASIVKIDILQVPSDELPALVERCRRFDVELLAEKVETPAQLLECIGLGFELFQGYLLSRPNVVAGRALGPGAASRLELVATLVDGERELSEVEAIVSRAPAMAHQLLELAGIGASHGTRREVRTLREALVLVGWRRLQSWAALLALVDHGAASHERTVTALQRARMCELLAPHAGVDVPGLGFTAGMVSSFDLLLDVDIGVAIADLAIGPELRDAALRGESELGRLVADVVDYQFGDHEHANRCGLDPYVTNHAWACAMGWALEVCPPTAASR